MSNIKHNEIGVECWRNVPPKDGHENLKNYPSRISQKNVQKGKEYTQNKKFYFRKIQ